MATTARPRDALETTTVGVELREGTRTAAVVVPFPRPAGVDAPAAQEESWWSRAFDTASLWWAIFLLVFGAIYVVVQLVRLVRWAEGVAASIRLPDPDVLATWSQILSLPVSLVALAVAILTLRKR